MPFAYFSSALHCFLDLGKRVGLDTSIIFLFYWKGTQTHSPSTLFIGHRSGRDSRVLSPHLHLHRSKTQYVFCMSKYIIIYIHVHIHMCIICLYNPILCPIYTHPKGAFLYITKLMRRLPSSLDIFEDMAALQIWPFWGFQALLVPSLSYQRVLMLVGMEHVGLRSMAAFSYAPDSFVTFLSFFGKALMHREKGSWCTTLWWSLCMVPVCSRAACTFGVRQQVFVNSPTCSWPTLSLWSVALTCTSWSRAFSTSWTPHSWV